MIEKILAYENGELTDEEIIEMFQELINTGTINGLQGTYQRMAVSLINAGLCHLSK